MVAGSAVRTLWTAKGLALKYCYGQGASCSDLLAAIKSYWALAYNLGVIPGYLGAVLLFALVLQRKTYNPRWTVVANPAVLMVLSPLADRAPAPLGAMLVSAFTNLSIAIFFLVSLLNLEPPPGRLSMHWILWVPRVQRAPPCASTEPSGSLLSK